MALVVGKQRNIIVKVVLVTQDYILPNVSKSITLKLTTKLNTHKIFLYIVFVKELLLIDFSKNFGYVWYCLELSNLLFLFIYIYIYIYTYIYILYLYYFYFINYYSYVLFCILLRNSAINILKTIIFSLSQKPNLLRY